MTKIIKLEKSKWAGNKWPSITILTDNAQDYDPELFEKVFNFIKVEYKNDIKKMEIVLFFDVPEVRNTADFKIGDCSVMMDMDGFMFSIAFNKVKTRNDVFDKMNDSKFGLVSI